MFEFLLGLFLALLSGTASIGQISSIDSIGNNPSFATVIEWECIMPQDGETCYLAFTEHGIETGP